ncbi:MAG: hypothetical protein KGL39_16875 [Patescibacteria group bacterium]|nr:hypothetical protein [Patescibacteria group bacterium]
MTPLYIFDLDGTLADCTHRLHHIQKNPKDWDAFNAGCYSDMLIEHVAHVFHALTENDCDVEIWTARNESTRQATEDWIGDNLVYPPKDYLKHMRPDSDHRHDDILKEEWLHLMSQKDRARLAGVFEDRSRVVEMWRRNGVPCFQVAKGDF